MPTDKQLFEIWTFQFQLFGGSGTPKQVNTNDTEGFGIAEENIADTPYNHQDEIESYGDVFGSVVFDPIEKELSIILNE